MARKKVPRKSPRRIQYVKEWTVSHSRTGTLEERINQHLRDRPEGDPRITDIHPMFVRSLVEDETRLLAVFERDDSRMTAGKPPGRERRKAPPEVVDYLGRKRNGGGETEGTPHLTSRHKKVR
jgi:hypothetical protein